MSEEEKGFVVRDKRGRPESEETPSAATTPHEEPKSTVHPELTGKAESTPDTEQPHPPVTFSSFVFSLSTSALMLMGEQLDPQQPSPAMNLPQAKEIIDILSMLDAKTKGNVSSDEQSVLADMLYTLRMKYVGLTSGTPNPASS